jgi:hypothetical protein
MPFFKGIWSYFCNLKTNSCDGFSSESEDSVAGRLSSEKLQQGPRRSYISTGAFPEWFSLYTATEIERVKTTGSTCDKVEFILAVL